LSFLLNRLPCWQANQQEIAMGEGVFDDSTYSFTIDAPLGKLNNPAQWFRLLDEKYRRYSAACFAADSTAARGGRASDQCSREALAVRPRIDFVAEAL
jgi:hypothetical protein